MAELDHVRWLGEAPGAGKTALAGALATGWEVAVLSTDELMSGHAMRGSRA